MGSFRSKISTFLSHLYWASEEYMIATLMILWVAISHPSLATSAEHYIRWSTGRTRPYLSSWALSLQRSRSHAGGKSSWSLGRWSTCPVGWNVVLRTQITRASSFLGGSNWLIGIWPRICSEAFGNATLRSTLLLLLLTHLKRSQSTYMEMRDEGLENVLY